MGLIEPTAYARSCWNPHFQRVSMLLSSGMDLATAAILSMDPQPDPETMKQILRYFVRNPQAADSLEGVARWRLLDEVVRRKVQDSQTALEWLVDKGFLRKTVVAGMEPIFSLNPARAADAAQFLREAEAADKHRKG